MTDQQSSNDAPSRQDRNVWPVLTYNDALAARDWLTQLGFLPGIVVPGERPDVVVHSEMIWPDGGRVALSSHDRADQTFVSQAGSANVYVVCTQPDEVFARAEKLGAEVIRPLTDSDYGSREFSVRDREGNSWSFGTYAG